MIAGIDQTDDFKSSFAGTIFRWVLVCDAPQRSFRRDGEGGGSGGAEGSNSRIALFGVDQVGDFKVERKIGLVVGEIASIA